MLLQLLQKFVEPIFSNIKTRLE